MCSTFRIPSSLSLLKAAWIGYCSCKFCCNLDAVRRWRFAYKLLNVKRSSRNVCANLKKNFTWRKRTKCRNMRIKEQLFHHMDCIGFFFYFLCSMWVLSVRSPCHVLCLQATIMAESSKFWQKPTNCATLATFKNEWRLPNFDRNSQIVQHLPIFKNEWYQQGERTTSILPIWRRVLVFGFRFPCSWVK